MGYVPGKTTRRWLVGVGMIAVFVLLGLMLPLVLECIQRLEGNHYPGTAQQAGAIALLGSGKQVALAILIHRQDHSEWPATLADVIREGLLTRQQLRYPKCDDLPDRRDIMKMKDFDEWIYIKPREAFPRLPLIVAPRPYTSSMGRNLPRPRRIIVDQETVATSVEEDRIAPMMRDSVKN